MDGRDPSGPDTPDLSHLPHYELAYRDEEFLARPELRPVRLQLELLKPELVQQEEGVASTIVVFGSSRIPAPEDVDEEREAAERAVEENPGSEEAKTELVRARQRCARAAYYTEARRFGRLVSDYCQVCSPYELVITTGGGPGIMEAANRGARDVDAKTMGLNIRIPHEQEPNPYVSPELNFFFQYFALRKMHFLLRAKALAIFPGGFGTLDELFDALTLIQTGVMDPIPVVLVGREYWDGVLDFDALVGAGTISPEDRELVRYADDAAEAWEIILDRYPEIREMHRDAVDEPAEGSPDGA